MFCPPYRGLCTVPEAVPPDSTGTWGSVRLGERTMTVVGDRATFTKAQFRADAMGAAVVAT